MGLMGDNLSSFVKNISLGISVGTRNGSSIMEEERERSGFRERERERERNGWKKTRATEGTIGRVHHEMYQSQRMGIEERIRMEEKVSKAGE